MAERAGACSESGASEGARDVEPMDTRDNGEENEVESSGKCVLVEETLSVVTVPLTDSTSTIDEESLHKALESVSKKWREVAVKAGFSEQEVQGIAEQQQEDEACLEEVVRKWLKTGVTWAQAVQLLHHVGDKDQAHQLATQKGVSMEEAQVKVCPPTIGVQKAECYAALKQTLKKGDTWYLVDMRWMKQWKKYVGYDQWDQALAGQETANPGPVDNSNLFKEGSPGQLKEHLMEELDYYLLPEAAWTKLSTWYGLAVNSCPIARRVVEHGMYMKHCKVEVYLMEFKLSIHPSYDHVVSRSFSKGDTVGDLEAVMREVFDVSQGVECRVWHRYLTNSYELLSTSSQTLQDAGLYSGQTIVLECRKEDGTWPRTVHTTSSSQHPTRSTDNTFTSSHQTSSASPGGYSSSGYYGSSYSHSKLVTSGLCGLSNLGNTCFMNSALQCLSNTTSLTKYFIGTQSGYKPYKKHINKDNPLGMGGAIAEAYGALLEDMWSGGVSCVAPRQFKTQVGRYAPQFVGYAQHDSQELLAFLLDGLHEDLNLVRKKPYVDMTVVTEGRSDKEIAEETWLKYLERNQSVIVRSFQGQLKSTLVCPDCKKLSKTFDPFMFLSLPLPVKKTRIILVNLVTVDPLAVPTTYKLLLPKRGIVADLKDELHKLSGIATVRMLVMDVYNSRFHRAYNDKDSLNMILDRDDIYVYELPPERENLVDVYVYFREETVRDVRYSSTSYTQRYHQLFGLPFIISIPKECKYADIYEAVMKKGSRHIKTWTQIKNEELSKEQSEWPQEDVDQNVVGEVEVGGDKGVTRDVEGNADPDHEPDNDPERDDKEEDRDVEMKEEEPEKEDNEEQPLYKLVIVNSYGSQEVQQLQQDKTYTFSKSVYLACDWSAEMRSKCYDADKAQELVRHTSCDVKENPKKNIRLMDCMQLFTQTEVLSRDDAWYCPHCKEFVQATKKFDLWKTPDVLVVHLKRFSYDRYWRDKLDVLVEFPIKGFDLTDLVQCPGEPQPVYDLYAISNHFGGMGGGHYTAYAKSKEKDKWYNYDDSHVSEVPESRLVSQSAYVLFYERRLENRRKHPVLDRSLSQSFAEEKKLLSNKYNADAGPSVPEETNSDEEVSVDVFDSNSNDNDLEQPD